MGEIGVIGRRHMIHSASAGNANPVILSGAGNHGRSRRTSNFQWVLERSGWAGESEKGLPNHLDDTDENAGICTVRKICALILLTRLAPRENPQDIGGPSTPPMIPRSAQDDMISFGARAFESSG